MKKNLLSYCKKGAMILGSVLMFNTAFSQTIYDNYQDGRIWFKLKNDQIVHMSISEENGVEADLNNLKLSTMPYLRNVFTAHSVTRLAQPFPKAYGSEALLRTYLLEFDDIHNVENIITELEESGAVDYAEKVPLDKITLTPNDPLFNASQMWGLYQINAPSAWNVGTGSASIVVATTDNAIQIGHPDLTNRIWVNTGEIPGNSNDDDNNGYVDDVNGYDVGDNDNNVNPPNNSWSHGTHVAGTTGAETNNGSGVASIGFGITMMPVKCTRNSAGSNSITDGYNGIYYAAINNADIINCSWGGTGFSTTGQNVVNFAWNNGCIVVAAAGNNNTNNDVTPHYPSNYSNAIAVASSTTNDVKSSFSNYGTNSIDITAPGSNILSTVPTNNYQSMQGTSMASPMVSGLLGLMKSLNPSMPNNDLINCMYSTAVNINAANPSYVNQLGAGRIDAFAAMNCVAATLSNPPVAQFVSNYTTITAGGTVTFTDLSSFGPTTWSWNFNNLNNNPGSVTPAVASTQGPHMVTYNAPGVYEVSLTVTNSNGSHTETKTAYINVTSPGACNEPNLDDNTFSSASSIHVGWTPTLYTATSGGHVAGLNFRDDKRKGEYFPAAMIGSNTQVVEAVWIWFGRAYSSNPNKTLDIDVYAANASGIPTGAPLGTRTITMGDIMGGGIYRFRFPTPVPLPASSRIVVSVDVQNLNWTGAPGTDSLGIVTSANGEAGTSTGLEQLTNNTWQNYSSGWGGITQLHHYIFPQLTTNPVNLVMSANPTTVCEGDQVVYNATGSTVQDTLLWSFPGMTPNYSTNIIDSMIYNTAGSYKTYLQIIGGACSNYAIDSVTITVNPTPSPSITSTLDTVCNSASVTLTCNPAGGSYLWTPGNQITQSKTITVNNTTTYNVAQTIAGCTGHASKTIYEVSSPVAAATFTPTSPVCANEGISFDGTGSTDANTYSWSFPQGSPTSSSSTFPTPLIGFGAGGTHSFSLTVTNVCGSDTYNGSITVNPPVDVSTTLGAGSITANATPATYQWVDCNNNHAFIPGETNQVFNPTNTGDYAVIVTQNGCTDTSACVNYIITGVNELNSGVISIYPNPANKLLNISLNGSNTTKITLSDSQGKLVYTSTEFDKESVLSIDLTAVSRGLYFLQIQGEDDVKTYKVIKE